ncbi:MAG TPA: OmpA family protein [Haliangium sp.]|nr:OmpA family protein [Haliangium sp.]
MRIVLALLAAMLVAHVPEARADACGVKLTVKAPRVKKRVDRSDNPSRILLLGEPPRTLAVSLSRAGHTVDVAEEPDRAQSKQYDLVVADPDQADEARSSFPGAQVVTRTGSSDANVREVERVLAREGKGSRDRVVARRGQDSRRQAREEPVGPRRVTSTTETARRDPVPTPAPRPAPRPAPTPTDTTPTDTTPTDETESSPTRVATIPRDRPADTETAPRRTEDEPDEPSEQPSRRSRRGEPRLTKELFFGTNSVRLSKRNQTILANNVRWLEANPGVSITLEGHTDASGPSEYNQELAQRRVDSIQALLIEAGIDASRIKVVSYGEEKLAYGSSSKNRRVVFVVEE